jgi:hypothetical protein
VQVQLGDDLAAAAGCDGPGGGREHGGGQGAGPAGGVGGRQCREGVGDESGVVRGPRLKGQLGDEPCG